MEQVQHLRREDRPQSRGGVGGPRLGLRVVQEHPNGIGFLNAHGDVGLVDFEGVEKDLGVIGFSDVHGDVGLGDFQDVIGHIDVKVIVGSWFWALSATTPGTTRWRTRSATSVATSRRPDHRGEQGCRNQSIELGCDHRWDQGRRSINPIDLGRGEEAAVDRNEVCRNHEGSNVGGIGSGHEIALSLDEFLGRYVPSVDDVVP